MSLINKMLKDLEQRQVNNPDNMGQIKSVHSPQKNHRYLLAILAFGFISVNAIAWFWWQTQHQKQPQPSSVQKKPVINIVQPVPALLPTIQAPPQPILVPPKPELVPPRPELAVSTLPLPPQLNTPAPTKQIPVTDNPAIPTTIAKQVQPLTPVQVAENTYRKATSLMQQGRTEESINELNRTLAIDPHHPQARLVLVGLLIDNKRNAEAERQLQQGLALDSTQPELSMLLARLLTDRGANHEAIKTLERGLPSAENLADYQALLATLLERTGQHKSAIEHYLAALKIAPQSGVWWIGLGIALQADGQSEKSRNAFIQARATNSLNADLLTYVEQQLK